MRSHSCVLIAAASARALAASARRAGYAPLVADFFGDVDTVEMAHAHIRLAGGLVHGMRAGTLIPALVALAGAHRPIGVAYGSGFEQSPDLLATISARWNVFGNDAATVALTKDPMVFAALCAASDVAHPETSLASPQEPQGWLVKRRGGAGGAHIRPATATDVAAKSVYFQRHVAGTTISVLFLADGRHASIIGFSHQWTSPTADRPYRYAGAVQPADLNSGTAPVLARAVHRLMGHVPLKGLNSADFLVTDTDFALVEINPRPGATLDIFESQRVSLFDRHMAAFAGRMATIPCAETAKAAAVVYTGRDIAALPSFDWPDWAADRQPAGSALAAGDPLCTVLATGPTAALARSCVDERGRDILLRAQGRAT